MASIAIGDIVRVTHGPRMNHLGEVKQLAQLAKDVDGTTNHARKVVASVSNGAETIEISATALKVVHKSKQPNNMVTITFLLLSLSLAYVAVRFGMKLSNDPKSFDTLDSVYWGFMGYLGSVTVLATIMLRPKRITL